VKVRHIRVGQLDVALLPGKGTMRWTILIDWRVQEEARRWRFAIGRRVWVPFSERYGYVTPPWRRRILGLDVAWYRRGLE